MREIRTDKGAGGRYTIEQAGGEGTRRGQGEAEEEAAPWRRAPCAAYPKSVRELIVRDCERQRKEARYAPPILFT